jgi:hypothetical protein
MTREWMSHEAVTERLKEAAERSDLPAGRRLATKIDMPGAAVTRRRRLQAAAADTESGSGGRSV